MTSPRELPYSLPGVPGIVTQSSYTATDLLSLQSDVRRDDEESDEDRLNYWLSTQGDPLLDDPPIRWHFPHLKTSAGAYAANDTEAELSLDQAPLPADDALMLE